MTPVVRFSQDLRSHLSSFVHDGGSVAELLFAGGRLNYPGRATLEYELGYAEPYTLEHEARVLAGLAGPIVASIRFLAREAGSRKWFPDPDPTLELLWRCHASWFGSGIALDRLVAALVMTEYAMNNRTFDDDVERAAETLFRGLHRAGLPPTLEGLEELFDGAYPACVGLGLVDL